MWHISRMRAEVRFTSNAFIYVMWGYSIKIPHKGQWCGRHVMTSSRVKAYSGEWPCPPFGHQVNVTAKQLKGEMSGTVWVAFTWDIYDIYIYIYISVVYSFCLLCCLFIIVTWWYVWCIVWASGKVGVNSFPELELQLNSNSNSGIGIGIEICGMENGIGIENSRIGIENRNWFFCNCYHSIN